MKKVKISSFDANVDKDVASAIENLKKANVRGIIFDVRNNPGGLLQVMVNTLDPLLPERIKRVKPPRIFPMQMS